MKIKTIDGNEAASHIAYEFSDVCGIYPITPSSPMAEHIDVDSSKNRKNIFGMNVNVVEMQSEGGAAGLVHGSLQAGALTSTFTASQGLLLMIPNMYKIAGEMLPCVFHVAARSLSTHALSIFGDHQDIYATRSTGFCMLASSSVQEAHDLALVAHLSTIKASLPFTHFFDGFRTSHELNKIKILDKEDYLHLVDFNKINEFRAKSLNINNPVTRGTAMNDDVYFQNTEARNIYYDKVPSIVEEYMNEVNKICNTHYQPFNYYGSNTATKLIVAMGSVCETIKETIDDLNSNGYNVGLIEVHLYRPFSSKHLLNIIPNTIKNIAVLDRTKEPGSIAEPLYLDVKAVIDDKDVVGGRYGLSSKNTTPSQIKAVYDMLDNPVHNFTIGINDDVTNLSLEVDKNYKLKDSNEILIYGYGSDGMVSASKSIIKIIGENTSKQVQGYFEYDSKKSGGVTVSHLRFSNNKIRSTYYVENPILIVVTKESYLNKYDMFDNLVEGGNVLITTDKNKEEFVNFINNKVKNILIKKKANIYLVDAYNFASKIGLNNKISTIMSSVAMSFLSEIDYDLAKEKMIEFAKLVYQKKGEAIFQANKEAIINATELLIKIELDNNILPVEEQEYNLFEKMSNRHGNDIKVSEFNPDGSFAANTSKLEKRMISNKVASLIKSNCIMCAQCSLVCPHGVIRPYLLSNKEYEVAPDIIKERCSRPFEPSLKDNYYFTLGISVKDCTGCGVCINTCPGKMNQKALVLNDLDQELENKEQDIFNYLDKFIKDKEVVNKTTIKGSQLREPKFCFSGACSGCGETPYVKLLTQLHGENMIIANATGCSSIYGGSAPSTPYNIPWASSLFEDNAEYGLGMHVANTTIRKQIEKLMKENMDNVNSELFTKWLDNKDNIKITKEVYENLDYNNMPKKLVELKDYIKASSVWILGGDGWAYDIGFSGIDHVLATNENVNILVLDTEVYSNTGGQMSKSSQAGALAQFAASGKKTIKKDLARIAMSYPHVYVAQTSLGANMMQTIKCLEEAANYNGPSLVIAYTPCISHGIKGGMQNSILSSKMATMCGYFPTFRYNPETTKFTLDSKNVDFDKYYEYLSTQSRYSNLEKVNNEEAKELLELNIKTAKDKYEYYKLMEKVTNE